ncbi:Gfo/Idh/MocA family oxidoreductase [Catalinimonas sp. 4WD22]|uniref:Gfo/Idh/MocA family protein n=1 Tax=Catalinimonas locisalis TaxID=3133978 RepID=UPI0031011FB5
MKQKNNFFNSRRKFVKRFSQSVASGLLLPSGLALSQGACSSQQEDESNEASSPHNDRLGIALVGLGNYSTGQLAPALQQTEKCYLAGIVTGTPSKAEEWKEQYNIPDANIYSYDNYDELADNPDIDIIYVVLPNSMHAEYTIRAAQAGKHVISEKPMATSVEDCQRMIAACEENNVRLGIGYRLHYEPYNLEMMRLGQEEIFGPVESIETGFAFTIGDPTQWRLDKELAGGGALMDVGIYTIQGACYTLGEQPVSLIAQEYNSGNEKFKEVHETIEFSMNFPSGLTSKHETSYSESYNYLKATAENGWFQLDRAFDYGPLSGKTSEGPMDFPQIREQAVHMDAFAEAVMNDTSFKAPGEMGLRDMCIIEAIYNSIENGNQEVEINYRS